MRTLRLLFIMTITLGISAISFGQTEINDRNNEENSIQVKYSHIDFLGLKISIRINEKWVITSEKKSTTLRLKHTDHKSEIEITTMNFSEALDNIFPMEGKKSANEIVSLFDSTKSGSNLSVKCDFSKNDMKSENGYELSTVYKTINKQAFLIKAKLDQNCIDYKKDFELIVESIQLLK